jgi:carboxyl-terminal processing protease
MSPLKWLPTFISLTIAFASTQAQMSAEQQHAIVLKRVIEKHHFSPRAVNDSFSSNVFSEVVSTVFHKKFLLTSEEYNQLAQYQYRLDDELNGTGWSFLKAVSSTYASSAKRADSLVTLILQKPLDLSGDEKIVLSLKQSAAFPSSPVELRQVLTKWLKLQLLNHLYDLSLAQQKGEPAKELFSSKEAAIRQKLRRTLSKSFQTAASDRAVPEFIYNTYLGAIATTFDPHTEFFSPNDREDFEMQLSTESKSFGFTIKEREGKQLVHHLVPGGPAWKSGELHRNDQLLQIELEPQEIIDVTMLSSDELEQLIEETTVPLSIKVKKGDGSIKTVMLQKEKIETEENKVKGYVLSGPRKVGYISLPDFYTAWSKESGSSCADDVAKEIVHLKKENIEGLVLDVRFNGGGSLDEALQLIGIFINEGPLLGVKERDGKLSYLKDPNRGTIYEGPMVVLINGQSASASEALAGCLQDYNRALIVGSTSFGKGTMQQIFPVDTNATTMNRNSALGYAKITTGKFYRLSGQTAQAVGVKPHLLLPDPFDVLEYKERTFYNSLAADTVRSNSYYKSLQAINIEQLDKASSSRLVANDHFAAVKRSMQRYSEYFKAQTLTIPLKLESFEKWKKDYDAVSLEAAPDHQNVKSLFAVVNHQYQMQRISKDPFEAELNTTITKKLEEDFYLQEAFLILSDLIKSKP